MDPIAQHSVFKLFHDHSLPSICPSAGSPTSKNASAYLLRELIRHDRLGIRNIQMCQIYQHLPHALVEHNGVTLLHELSHNLSLVILDNEDLDGQFRFQRPESLTDLFGLDHLFDHDQTKV
jgi:hypothetical protein